MRDLVLVHVEVFFDKELSQKYWQAFVKICFNWRLLSIILLKVLNPFHDCREHIMVVIIKDRALLHFVKHCDYLFTISFLSPLMPHFLKQTLIVKLVTSYHASCSHQIATSTSTPLTICVADASYWILVNTYLTSLFWYLTWILNDASIELL